MNNILIGFASIIIGYLLGSISFSRIVTRIVSPGLDLNKTLFPLLGSEEKIQMSGVSPTSVRLNLGPKYGLLASFLDMIKVAIPVAIFHFVFPATPGDYLAATGGIIGHNWPIYYKFNGGYGHSAIYGALFVFDWRAILFNLISTSFLILIFKQVHIASWGGVLLLIPWFYFFHHDPFAILYCIVSSLAYLIRILPDFKAARNLQNEKPSSD